MTDPTRFQIGENVMLLPARGASMRLASECVILALLPIEKGPQQYRVKSLAERHERIVSETDLQPMPVAQ